MEDVQSVNSPSLGEGKGSEGLHMDFRVPWSGPCTEPCPVASCAVHPSEVVSLEGPVPNSVKHLRIATGLRGL